MGRQVCVVVLAVLIIGGFGIVGQAKAGFYDGNKLMEFYKEYEKAEAYTGDKSININWVDDGKYIGYVTGVFDSHQSRLCQPEGDITVRAVCTIVGNYLKAHPESWGQPADAIILKALKEAYPCPKKGGK